MLELVTYSQPIIDNITDEYFWVCSLYNHVGFCYDWMFLMPEVLD